MHYCWVCIFVEPHVNKLKVLWSPSNPTVKTSWKKTSYGKNPSARNQELFQRSAATEHGKIARGSVVGDRQPPHQHSRDVWCTSEWSRLFHHPPCCQWRRIHSEFSNCHLNENCHYDEHLWPGTPSCRRHCCQQLHIHKLTCHPTVSAFWSTSHPA